MTFVRSYCLFVQNREILANNIVFMSEMNPILDLVGREKKFKKQ